MDRPEIAHDVDELRARLAVVGSNLRGGEAADAQNLERFPNSEIGVCDVLLWMHDVGRRHMPKRWYPLSEFAFFMRFMVDDNWSATDDKMLRFEPSSSAFFALPDVEVDEAVLTDSGIVYEVFLQQSHIDSDDAEPPELKAWRLLMGSKMTNMTACGHFSDTLTW